MATLPSTATVHDGLPPALDKVAEQAPPTHAFLRRQWYAAALAAYGGTARTLVVRRGDEPLLALPFVASGPAWLRVAGVPGCYWPFRSFPAADTSAPVLDAALAALPLRALRIGPVYDGDPGVTALLDRARAAGWAIRSRQLADSYLLDIAAEPQPWPRNSTLRKNRFHEKHLAAHGSLDRRFVSGADWPRAFDALAAVEEKSWIASRTDGADAKFTATGHGAFWRAAAADPVLAQMMRAALLTVDGVPAAFSFDLDVGTHRYAIANSYAPAIAKHSPGRLLQYRNLVDARARGIRTVDWGMGDSGYKQALGAVAGPAFADWLLLKPGMTAMAGRMLQRRWTGGPASARA